MYRVILYKIIPTDMLLTSPKFRMHLQENMRCVEVPCLRRKGNKVQKQPMPVPQIQEAPAEQAAGAGGSLTVVQRMFDARDRYVEDDATGT